MNDMNKNAVNPVFHEGDAVVLVCGPYPGTRGSFLGLKGDPAWADITERNGTIRSHPVEWLGPLKLTGGTQAGAVK
jgi:hypothetical protein